jgi:LmbE family N-acetylglucosaminyl deacetylase
MALSISSKDRILVIAPHPDDESIGTGGLLQRARHAGAKVRVIFCTSGDNNPWPQRAIERRLLISTSARLRWAARRREEARAALRFLLGNDDSALFLNLPDQGVTRLLLHGGEQTIATMRAEFAALRPTIVVLPSENDAHPDHSALHVLARFAFTGSLHACRVFTYVVHRRGNSAPWPSLLLRLTDAEVRDKRHAILCHETQMALSRRRFTAYARTEEPYDVLAAPGFASEQHPVREAEFTGGALRLLIRTGRTPFPRRRLFIAAQSIPLGMVRWSLVLPARSRMMEMQDETSGALPRCCTVRVKDGFSEVKIPAAAMHPIESVFVKISSRRFFFVSSGWREVPPPGGGADVARRKIRTARREEE